MSDPEIQACEVCKGLVDRLITPSSFHLKGSGWYTTDYKNSSSKTATNESKGVEPKTENPKSDKPLGNKSEGGSS